MPTFSAYGESRLLFWQRVRKFAVPRLMIETATARRAVGDWAGACAAARVDADLCLRAVARAHGRELAARVRADLRRLAPDLLRWHMPRIAPEGLLRPGVTISLARYHPSGPSDGGAVHLVARTPPAWADAGQRISLALWEGSCAGRSSGLHPHPHPDRRFRLDLHRHLWDAHQTGDLRERAGAVPPPADRTPAGPEPGAAAGIPAWPEPGAAGGIPAWPEPGAADRTPAWLAPWAADGGPARPLDPTGLVPQGFGCAVQRWAPEAVILLRSLGSDSGTVAVRLGARRRLVLHVSELGVRVAPAKGCGPAWPELPDAAIRVLPDLALLRAGLVEADQLHPLVAAALVPGSHPAQVPQSSDGGGPRLVECRSAWHRIGLVDGRLVPLDHDPAELHREALLVALGGPPLPCLQVIDEVHRHPESLVDVRCRLDHGDATGALAVVEELLGPDALLRSGPLRDELESAAQRRVTHGLYRAGLAGWGPPRQGRDQRREARARLRHSRSH